MNNLQNTRAISVVSEMPQNREQLETYNSILKDAILSGEFNTLDVAKQISILRRVADFFEKDKDIQDAVLKEAEKYSKTEREGFEIREVGVSYDFTGCNNPNLQRLEAEKQRIESEIKQFKYALKVKGGWDVDTVTGEICEINKAIKTSTTKVVFTLK